MEKILHPFSVHVMCRKRFLGNPNASKLGPYHHPVAAIRFSLRPPSPKWPYPKGPRVLGPKCYDMNGI